MKLVEVTTEIGAPAETVWQVLIDFEKHPSWNPFIKRISGLPIAGQRLRVHIAPPGGRGMTFKPRVVAAKQPHELRWLGRFLFPGLFDGEHAFVITPTSEASCRLTQSEKFSGLLVAMSRGTLDATRDGFAQMNDALKGRAELLATADHGTG